MTIVYDAGMPTTVPWFFTSYARLDDEQDAGWVRTFHDQLATYVARRVPGSLTKEQVGFLDQTGLDVGDVWPDDIAQALAEARTFVPIMTKTYFERPFCGQEWQAFEERGRDHVGPNQPLPRLIIPVVWNVPLEGKFPDFAMDLHTAIDVRQAHEEEQQHLRKVVEQGLVYVAKRPKSGYAPLAMTTMVEHIGSRIVELAGRTPLPPLPRASFRPLTQVANRFDAEPKRVAATGGKRAADYRANFAVVAGRAAEMAAIREQAELYYGADFAEDWMPYAPDDAFPIAADATDGARANGLYPNWITADEGLLVKIQEAKQQYMASVLIVDPWSAQHDRFRQILKAFDERRLINCVVLVAWSGASAGPLAKLEQNLQSVMEGYYEMSDELYFRKDITDRAMLRAEITAALAFLETRLAPKREPVRQAGQGSAKGARTSIPNLTATPSES